jgi:hypothetical protein
MRVENINEKKYFQRFLFLFFIRLFPLCSFRKEEKI